MFHYMVLLFFFFFMFFFFFKQKTAYEIVDCDWSSDVCSSDLQVKDYFNRIHNKEVQDIEYIKEQSLDFCRKQNLKEADRKSVV
mgnify:CR=1 FL=1